MELADQFLMGLFKPFTGVVLVHNLSASIGSLLGSLLLVFFPALHWLFSSIREVAAPHVHLGEVHFVSGQLLT